MNLTIKNVPEKVYKTLKNEAAQRARSLNSEVILALTATAEEIERRRQMRASWSDLEHFVASLPPMPDSAPLIRAERERR